MNIFLLIKMSYCKLNHTLDEVISEEGISAQILVENIQNRDVNPSLISSRVVIRFMEDPKNLNLKNLFGTSFSTSEVIDFVEKFNRWKKIVRGDNTSIELFEVLKLVDGQFEPEAIALSRIGNLSIDFENDKDVLYSILYLFNKTNLTEENKVFIRKIVSIFDQNKDLLDDTIKKQLFEFQLKNLKDGTILDGAPVSFYIKDADLSSKYPIEYKCVEKLITLDYSRETIEVFREVAKTTKNEKLKLVMYEFSASYSENLDDLYINELKFIDEVDQIDINLEIQISRGLANKITKEETRLKDLLKKWREVGLTENDFNELRFITKISDATSEKELIYKIQNDLINKIQKASLDEPPVTMDQALIAIREGDLETVLQANQEQLIGLIPILEQDVISVNAKKTVKISQVQEEKLSTAVKFLISDQSYIQREASVIQNLSIQIESKVSSVLQGEIKLQEVLISDFYLGLDDFEKLKFYESLQTANVNRNQTFTKIDPMLFRSTKELDQLEGLYKSSLANLELSTESATNIRRSLQDLQDYRASISNTNLTQKLEGVRSVTPNINLQLSLERIPVAEQDLIPQIDLTLKSVQTNILVTQNIYLDSLPLPKKSKDLLDMLNILKNQNATTTLYDPLILEIKKYHRDLFRSGLKADDGFFNEFNIESFIGTLSDLDEKTKTALKNLFDSWKDSMFGTERLKILDSFLFQSTFDYQKFFPSSIRLESRRMIDSQIKLIQSSSSLSTESKRILTEQLENFKNSLNVQGTDLFSREPLNLSKTNPDNFVFIEQFFQTDPLLKQKYNQWEIVKRTRETPELKVLLQDAQQEINSLKNAQNNAAQQAKNVIKTDETGVSSLIGQEYGSIIESELPGIYQTGMINEINIEIAKINQDVGSRILESIPLNSQEYDALKTAGLILPLDTVDQLSVQKKNIQDIYNYAEDSLETLNSESEISKLVYYDDQLLQVEILTNPPNLNFGTSTNQELILDISLETDRLKLVANPDWLENASKPELRIAYDVVKNHHEQLKYQLDLREIQRLLNEGQDRITHSTNGFTFKTPRFQEGTTTDLLYLQFRINTDIRKANLEASKNFLASFDQTKTWSQLVSESPIIQYVKSTLDTKVLQDLNTKTIQEIINQLSGVENDLSFLERISVDLQPFYLITPRPANTLIHPSSLGTKINETKNNIDTVITQIRDQSYQSLIQKIRNVHPNETDLESKIRNLMSKLNNRPVYVSPNEQIFFRADYLEAKFFEGRKVFQKRVYSKTFDSELLNQEIETLISKQIQKIENLPFTGEIESYREILKNAPDLLQKSEESVKQEFLKYMYLKFNEITGTNTDYVEKIESYITKIQKYNKNRIQLLQGTFGNQEYNKVISNFFKYAPVDESNFIVYQKDIDRILENALRQNRLQEVLTFIEISNERLSQLIQEKSKTLFRLNLQTENVKAFQHALLSLEDRVQEKLHIANSMREMLDIATVYHQPSRVHYLIEKLRFGTPHYTRELLAMSGVYFNIPVSVIMMGRFGSWQTIVDVITFLGLSTPEFNRISATIGYFDRLRSIIQGYTFKGLGNSTRYLPRTIFSDYAYNFDFNISQTLIKIGEWMRVLYKYYNEQIIDLDEWSQLIFVHYKQNQIDLVPDNYCINFIQDLEIYIPSLYETLDISNNYTTYKNRFCQNFINVREILLAIDGRNIVQYQAQIGQRYGIQIPDQISFVVPYSLMIDQIAVYSQYDWNAFVDIEPLFGYDNFSMETFYLQLFLKQNISQLQKILVLLKACYLSDFKDSFLVFLQNNFTKITQADISGSTIQTRIEKDILSLIIASKNTLTFIPFLYQIYLKQPNEIKDFIQAILYFYLYTDYKLQPNISSILMGDLELQIKQFGLAYDLSSVNMDEYILQHPLYLIDNFDAKASDFLGKYNFITQRVIHHEQMILTPDSDDLNEIKQIIFENQEPLDLIDDFSRYENVIYAINFDLKSWILDIMNDLSITVGKKFLFLTLIKCPYLSIYETLFGIEVSNFLVYQIQSPTFYEKIYQLYSENKIDSYGLISILLSYSTFENIPFENLSKKSVFDIATNINLNTDKYIQLVKLKIFSSQRNLHDILPSDQDLWSTMIMKNRFFKDQFLNVDIDRIHHESELQGKQNITSSNMNKFISIFISKNIQNPLELYLFFERFNFVEDGVFEKVKYTLKDLNYLNKFFYKNWIESQSIGEIYSIQTPTLLAKLLESEIMDEEEFFDVLELVSNYNALLNSLSYEYEFKKPIQDFKFYPKLVAETNHIQRNGLTNTSQPKSYIDKRPEDVNSLLTQINKNIPLSNQINQFQKKMLVGEKFDEDLLLTQIYNDISGSIKEQPKELTDEELELAADQKNFQEIDKYLMYLNKDKSTEIQDMISSVNARVIATQTILSMFDPTQVLVDYLFDDLLNNGMIPNEINNRNLPMKVSSFPSFYMAYQIVYSLASRWVEKNVLSIDKSIVNPNDKILEKLKSQDANFMRDIRQDYENIMNNSNEKYTFLKSAYWQTIMYVKFIHNENPIAFNPDLSVSNASKYHITMNESAKMVAAKGGDGMVKLEKF